MPNYNKKTSGKIVSGYSSSLSSLKDSLKNVNNSKAIKYIQRKSRKIAADKEASEKYSEYSNKSKERSKLRDAEDRTPIQEKGAEAAQKIVRYFKAHNKRKDERAVRHVNPKRLLWILAVVLLILIILSGLSTKVRAPFNTVASLVVVPIQKGVNSLGLWLSDKIEAQKTLDELIKENQELKAQVDELTVSLTTLTQEDAELKRLKDLLKMKNQYSSYEMVGANIVAKESGKWFSTFTIDKGSADGIKKDMNVIADGGLVGIVVDVGYNFSTVRSIIEDESSVSAQFEDNSQLCIVNGSIALMEQNLLEFTDVGADVFISLNGAVVTSHISSKYLPGILIGYVTEYRLDSNDLTQSGYIKPVVDFSNLKEVMVITTTKEISD